MDRELEKAKKYLDDRDCTCVLCHGAAVICSHRRGVAPLLEILENGTDVRGFFAADKVVGQATAFLYCLLGVRAVYARVISLPAMEVLEKHGIAVTGDTLVEGIRNRDNTGPCPMEAATRDITDPKTALTAIKSTLQKLQNNR